jgi:hypothetical protein
MTNDMQDLVRFLSSPRADVRRSAMHLCVGLTGTDDGVHHLVKADAIKALCRLLSDMDDIAREAIHALVNITATYPRACEIALKHDIVNRLMNQLDTDNFQHKDLAMMLLANVTTTAEGAKALVANKDDDTCKINRDVILQKLTMLFLMSEPEPNGVDPITAEPTWDDDYQYIANVLANITQLEEGRAFLLMMRKVNNTTDKQEPKTCIVSQSSQYPLPQSQSKSLVQILMPQIHSPNVVRRRGIVQAVRNLCFDSENHFYLYDTLDIVSHMQKRLAGPEPLNAEEDRGMSSIVLSCLTPMKKRESDACVRKASIECLLLLCASRHGRVMLRQKKVYPIVRNAHVVEDDNETSEQMYKLVEFLIRDEEGEEPDWNEIRAKAMDAEVTATDNDPAHVFQERQERQTMLTSPPCTASTTAVIQEDEENDRVESCSDDEVVDAAVAAALANEIHLLDVSDDETDEDDDEIPPLVP